MQASSLILVKHFDYFTWISVNQVLGVLMLTDADVKRNMQKTIYNYKILERLIIAASGWHLEQFLAQTRYTERTPGISFEYPPSLNWFTLSQEQDIYERSPIHRKATREALFILNPLILAICCEYTGT